MQLNIIQIKCSNYSITWDNLEYRWILNKLAPSIAPYHGFSEVMLIAI